MQELLSLQLLDLESTSPTKSNSKKQPIVLLFKFATNKQLQWHFQHQTLTLV
jgi:hypothetical protein